MKKRGWLHKIAELLDVIVGFLAIVSVIFAFTSRDAWWMRAFDYVRLQIALVSVATFIASFFVFDLSKRWTRPFIAVLGAAVLWQGYILHPYFLPIAPQVAVQQSTDADATISVMVANVLMENRDAAAFVDIVEQDDPDIVLAIETNEWWIEQLAPLRQRYAHVIEEPQSNHYGIALYSRHPLSETQINHFENEETPSIFSVVTLPTGSEIEFYGLHPRPPLPENSVSLADKELIKVAEAVKAAERPVVVAGDFNDVPWSYTLENFQEIGRLQDLRVGRGFYNTFDAKSFWLRTPIDHIFVTPDLGLTEIKKPIRFSSDHFAFFAELIVQTAR